MLLLKVTCLVLGVNVPLLLQLPASFRSPPLAEDRVRDPPDAFVTLPVTVMGCVEAPRETRPPLLTVKLPPMLIALPPEVFPFSVPVTETLPPVVKLLLKVLKLKLVPVATVRTPLSAAAPYVPLFADTSNVPVLMVTLFG